MIELTCDLDGVCSVCGERAHQPKPIPENDRCMRRCPTCGAHYFGPPLHYGFKQWCPTPAVKV